MTPSAERRSDGQASEDVKSFWALYDQHGDLFNFGYESYEAADGDAVGPIFRRGHTVREYRMVPRKDESPRGTTNGRPPL